MPNISRATASKFIRLNNFSEKVRIQCSRVLSFLQTALIVYRFEYLKGVVDRFCGANPLRVLQRSFLERHVKMPMKPVFNAPMVTYKHLEIAQTFLFLIAEYRVVLVVLPSEKVTVPTLTNVAISFHALIFSSIRYSMAGKRKHLRVSTRP